MTGIVCSCQLSQAFACMVPNFDPLLAFAGHLSSKQKFASSPVMNDGTGVHIKGSWRHP